MSLGSYVGQILIYTISGITVTTLTVVGGREFKRRGAFKRLEDSLETISVALLGKKPSAFEPHPEPGMMQRLESYRDETKTRMVLGDALMAEFADHKKTLEKVSLQVTAVEIKLAKNDESLATVMKSNTELAAKVDSVQSDVKSLVNDTRKNGGASGRDVLNQIKDAVVKPLATTPEVRSIVHEHDAHVAERQDEIMEAINLNLHPEPDPTST